MRTCHSKANQLKAISSSMSFITVLGGVREAEAIISIKRNFLKMFGKSFQLETMTTRLIKDQNLIKLDHDLKKEINFVFNVRHW